MSEYIEMQVAGSELLVGDFIDQTNTYKFQGVKGGRYIEPAVRIQASVTAIPFGFPLCGLAVLRVRLSGGGAVRVFPNQTLKIRRPQEALVA